LLDFPPNVAHSLDVRLTLLALVLLTSIIAAPLRAADIRTLQVDDDHQGRYTVMFDALLDTPPEIIHATIANPARWPQLSHIVTAAEVLGELPDGRRKVSVSFQDCILIFCQTIHKNEALTTTADGQIDTLAFPEQSDFSYAHEHWRISAEGRHTRIHYQAEMTPSFYVPPMVGAYILKAKIRSLLRNITANLEALAGP
jgi:hypothetical protein